jgi:leucine dehydrogenase
MTYKAAISGLNLGGGKAVIIGDARKDKTPEMMQSFGRYVERLSGNYITAEDVGMSEEDMSFIRRSTRHVTGVAREQGGSGDPSPVTAYGVYKGMKAAAMFKWGNESLSGKKVLVQGVGSVGHALVEYLSEEGASIFISDIYEDKLIALSQKHKCEIVPISGVYSADVDIYAPCALGATLNDDTIPQLKCEIVAGAANNQLANEERHGQMLVDSGILYAPDFLINAGGLINVYSEIASYSREEVMKRSQQIFGRTLEILEMAREREITPQSAAIQWAEKRLREAENKQFEL